MSKNLNPNRLLSLDVFRGITILGMILVNNPGSWGDVYPPLLHAEWHGCTPTDLIFPFFLFIMGVSTVFSLDKFRINLSKENAVPLLGKILKRAAILFALGLFLAGFPKYNFETIRIPGVLQRIGVVYLFVSLLFLVLDKKKILYTIIGILLAYWAMMTLIPVPGLGYATLAPENNLAAWLDRLLLSGHLYRDGIHGDPEGILSTLPAIATSLLGLLTGYLLKGDKDKINKTVWLFFYGISLMFIGYVWDFWFPFNKNLWTSSYVIYTGGLALVFLGFCYWTIDVLNKDFWVKPFHIYGTNAITVFVLSGFVARLLNLIKLTGAEGEEIALKTYIYNNFYLSIAAPINASLMFAISYILFWLFMIWLLYRKNIFIKI